MMTPPREIAEHMQTNYRFGEQHCRHVAAQIVADHTGNNKDELYKIACILPARFRQMGQAAVIRPRNDSPLGHVVQTPRL
jgi:hypothetical protein